MYNIGEENKQIEFKKSTGELKEGVIAIADHIRQSIYPDVDKMTFDKSVV